ncbi:hypothetical protein B0H13DRAFT_1861614 [Mycena leptocephala]|nr:hypothetical protein B0H13DRAFT_1861614 [Mycena leptocephala]
MRTFRQTRRTATTVLAGDFDVCPPHVPMLRTDNDEIEHEKRNVRKRKRAKLPVKRIEAVDDAPVPSATSSVRDSTTASTIYSPIDAGTIQLIQHVADILLAAPPRRLRGLGSQRPSASSASTEDATHRCQEGMERLGGRLPHTVGKVDQPCPGPTWKTNAQWQKL